MVHPYHCYRSTLHTAYRYPSQSGKGGREGVGRGGEGEGGGGGREKRRGRYNRGRDSDSYQLSRHLFTTPPSLI
jgi:hypothetical protein